MKYMYVIYDCDICGEFHILKSTWSVDFEMDLKCWKLSIEGEIVASLESQIFQAFCKLHSANEYTNSRLMFSQVFEKGDENEKENS